MTIEELVNMVSEDFGLDLKSKNRDQDHVVARTVFFKLAYDDLSLGSLKKVGNAVNRDHATVLHSLKNIFPSLKGYFSKDYNKYLDLKNSLSGFHQDKVDAMQSVLDKYKEVIDRYETLLFMKEENDVFSEDLSDDASIKIIQLVSSVPKEKKELLLEKLQPIVRMI